MASKPILFNTEMVRAILDGRKTQTRRIIPEKIIYDYYDYDDWCNAVIPRNVPCTREYEYSFFKNRARYQPGDILWVRETFCEVPYEHNHVPIKGGHITIPKYAYKADSERDYTGIWKPSIHMPREAARIFLRVKNVRVERLQEITPVEVVAEGMGAHECRECIATYGNPCCQDEESECGLGDEILGDFRELWDSLNAKRGYGWDINPWVWVYEFERVSWESVKYCLEV